MTTDPPCECGRPWLGCGRTGCPFNSASIVAGQLVAVKTWIDADGKLRQRNIHRKEFYKPPGESDDSE